MQIFLWHCGVTEKEMEYVTFTASVIFYVNWKNLRIAPEENSFRALYD